ncbi:MAG: hypothetical protein HKN47_13300 [Pirellulaceae bacterium]|nr:hypothetical protein [Pirellulaceae bacterium]
MKKFLFLAVSLIVCATVVLATAATSSRSTQRDFFQTIQAGGTSALINEMHPALIDQIDAPVLDAWVDAVHRELGDVTDIQQTAFHTSVTNEQTTIQSTATITFERGTATSELTTVDGKIVGFDITSKRLINWLTEPTSTEIYESRGKRFLMEMLSGNPQQARAMVHQGLKDVITLEQLTAMATQLQSQSDSQVTPTITAKSASMNPEKEAPELLVQFEIVDGDQTRQAEVAFQFEGMKGHILGFQIR